MNFPSQLFSRPAAVSLEVAVSLCLFGFASGPVQGVEGPTPEWSKVRPVMAQYCYGCHGGEKTKGGLDLKVLETEPAVGEHYDVWETVKWAIEDEEMPPADDPQLSEEEKDLALRWLDGALIAAASANAGDPGFVTVRRLTNVEYDRTIRDLTGIDYGLSANFQPDGGGGEGFSNVGDVLFVNPQQLASYLAAARDLTAHASVLPGRGIRFRKQRVGLRSPVQLRTEAEQSLYIWYQKMAEPHLPQDGEDRRGDEYMTAAWKFKHREATGAKSLDQLAKEADLNAAFLHNWWALLNSAQPKSRFLDLIRVPWQALPGPIHGKPKEIPAEVGKRILDIEAKHLAWNKREGEGWTRTQRRQQDTDGLRTRSIVMTIPEGEPLHLVAGDFGDGNRGDLILFERIEVERGGKWVNYVDWLRRKLEGNRSQIAKLEAAPESKSKELEALRQFNREGQATLARFGKHPQKEREIGEKELAVRPPELIRLPFTEKARVRVSAKMDLQFPEADHGTHQWTIAGANPPDPKKIIPGALIIYKRQTEVARQVMGDFSRMKVAFPDEYNRLLEEVSRNYLRGGKGNGVYYLSDEQLRETLTEAQRQDHERMLDDWALLRNPKYSDKSQKEIDSAIIGHLEAFAFKAWRRPLATEEKEMLSLIYHDARSRELDVESAGREALTRILISPDFLFKLERSSGSGIHPVTPWELATRLSYLLWSTMPDAALFKAAGDGSLKKPEGFRQQIRRMLKDPKADALAEEFAGQWLEFHAFSKHGAVDPKTFPEFTDELRADMHRESQLFFEYLIREDRPVREILTADYTFLNERLATHYSIPEITGDQFRKVSVAEHRRGGLLGMGSVLTKTSFPQRTSPVLRGHWLLLSVMGQSMPPPPADVPELEAITDAKTLREKLLRHREDKACSSCHDRIDPLGFALEGFDAIGRLRTIDETGAPVDDSGTLRDGTALEGIAGLRKYLGSHDEDFYDLFARKMIGYATGRSVLATDRQLIEEVAARLSEGEGRFSDAIFAITESRQFQNRHNE